ncbi:hypothetical protein [Collimonas sp.]|uniref:hypothetical protein n=1 Tax=Collimonas sp. TaxID=1963772 RepID=UPI002B8ABF1B|nr:hypothetical protein [Collimonas sp.]HWW07705.1 hypothetical protein [Collimonas sp.]
MGSIPASRTSNSKGCKRNLATLFWFTSLIFIRRSKPDECLGDRAENCCSDPPSLKLARNKKPAIFITGSLCHTSWHFLILNLNGVADKYLGRLYRSLVAKRAAHPATSAPAQHRQAQRHVRDFAIAHLAPGRAVAHTAMAVARDARRAHPASGRNVQRRSSLRIATINKH